jgi:hypothetical protein
MRKCSTIFDSTILDIKLINNGVQTSIESKVESDRTIVVIRYQLAVLPSNKLKKPIVEQEWLGHQE